ncbi:MAG: protein-L-isoaspartate(D-aspartate) O-methyltransferase [Betaproteobacteria bacterium]|nr:protein-L-isoaspartate(D-aspartate) O-methyltransferase [Betaproteobacteria bacterium]
MKQKPSFPAKVDGLAPKKVHLAKGAAHFTGSAKSSALDPFAALASGVGLDSTKVRESMVQKLAQQGVQDEMLLRAFSCIERHKFIDTALANQAYEDTSLPIGFGQTISKPNVIGRMIELLRQGKNLMITGKLSRVLEIGTGCGYQAAILGQVSKEVYSIERIQGLYEKAKENLRPMRFPNIHLILGDGMLGFAQGAPYAGIISAAGGENIPTAWLDQLAVGGRLVAPISNEQGSQVLVVIDKFENSYKRSFLEPVNFVPLLSGVA